jgi:hypothetical protein
MVDGAQVADRQQGIRGDVRSAQTRPRPLASVTQIGPVLAERRAERVIEAIRRMTKEA